MISTQQGTLIILILSQGISSRYIYLLQFQTDRRYKERGGRDRDIVAKEGTMGYGDEASPSGTWKERQMSWRVRAARLG